MSWKMFWRYLSYHWRYHIALIFSWLVPRSRKVWVIGGSKGLRFADNARHFTHQARRTWPDQTIIWLSPSAEVRAQAIAAGILTYPPTSLLGLWYGFRAKWHIFDVSVADTSHFSSIGANRLHLWHGVPLKSLDNIQPQHDKGWTSWLHDWWYRKHRQYQSSYLVHPTPAHFHYLSKVLNIPLENIVRANLPRNIQLLKGDYEGWSVHERHLRDDICQNGKRIIGYFPTWRDTGLDSFMGATSVDDIRALDDLLKQQNAMLITKWHSCSYEEYQHRGVSQTAAEIDSMLKHSECIRMLPFNYDLNTVLGCCDVLISDYSGALIDFLLLQRPIIQAPYDLEEYQIFTGLLSDYSMFAKEAGPVATDFPQLLQHLMYCLQDYEGFQSDYRDRQVSLQHYYFPTMETVQALETVLKPV